MNDNGQAQQAGPRTVRKLLRETQRTLEEEIALQGIGDGPARAGNPRGR